MLSLAKGEDEVRFTVIDDIGDLGGPVVGIDRDAAHADAVEGKRVKDMFGPILQQRCNSVACSALVRRCEPSCGSLRKRRCLLSILLPVDWVFMIHL